MHFVSMRCVNGLFVISLYLPDLNSHFNVLLTLTKFLLNYMGQLIFYLSTIICFFIHTLNSTRTWDGDEVDPGLPDVL